MVAVNLAKNLPRLRWCSKCNRLLPAEEFHNHRWCKECGREYARAWRVQHKDRVAAAKVRYRERHAEHVREHLAQYRAVNHERIMMVQAAYREAHRTELAAKARTYVREHADEAKARRKAQYWRDPAAARAKSRQYNREHAEEKRAKDKQYYAENREAIREWSKGYYERHKDELREAQAQYYQRNKERIREYFKRWYASGGKQWSAEYSARYRAENPHVKINSDAKRRALLAAAGEISKEDWLSVMRAYDWCCAYCGVRLTKETRTIDHVLPLSRGGRNLVDNIVPACRTCNSSKHAHPLSEWRRP